MSLIKFTSDMGRGYQNAVLYLESTAVESIIPTASQYTSSNNRTVITMKSGEVHYVTGYVEDNIKTLQSAKPV